MAKFDPKAKRGGGGGGRDEGVPAGDYLLIMKSFTRRTGKDSGAPYLRALFKVIHGPAKDKTFFDSVSIDPNNNGAMTRLAMFCEQTDTGEFDLDVDSELRDALLNKPFKARVSRDTNGSYVNNGVARYLNNEVTDFERRVIDTWLVDYAESASSRGGSGPAYGPDADGLPDDVPPPGDDDIGGYGYGNGGGRGGRSVAAPDDDIPF